MLVAGLLVVGPSLTCPLGMTAKRIYEFAKKRSMIAETETDRNIDRQMGNIAITTQAQHLILRFACCYVLPRPQPPQEKGH